MILCIRGLTSNTGAEFFFGFHFECSHLLWSVPAALLDGGDVLPHAFVIWNPSCWISEHLSLFIRVNYSWVQPS